MNQKHFSPAAPLAPDTTNEQVKFFATGFNKLELAALLVHHSTVLLLQDDNFYKSIEPNKRAELAAKQSVKVAESILDRCDIEREKFIIENGGGKSSK